MLMPPAQSGSQFDFILKDPQKSKKTFGIPSGVSKPVLILGGSIVVLVLALALGIILGHKGPNNSAQILNLMAQDQEIIRVTNANQNNFKDPNNLALSATTVASLTSQQTEFGKYLAKIGTKYKPEQLNALQNKQTDATLQTSVTNNNFDQAFDKFLQTSLEQYQASILSTAKNSTQNFNAILGGAYNSNKTLLSSPQLVSLPSS